MKKITFLLIFLFASSQFFGQKPDSPWWVGGRLGVGFNTVSGKYSSNDDNQHKWITTPTFGAIGMYTFTDMISVTGELNIAKSGALYISNWEDEGGEEIEGQFKERYTTMQIPITARFTFGEEWQYYGYAGIYWSKILCGKYVDKIPAYDYEESGKIKFGDEPENYEGDDWYLDKDNNRRMDFGMVIGAGVQRELGPGTLAFDFRFSQGFCDSYKWPDNDKPDGYKPYLNRAVSLTVMYFFLIN